MRIVVGSVLSLLVAMALDVGSASSADPLKTDVDDDILAVAETALARLSTQAEHEPGPKYPPPSSEVAFMLLTGLAAQGSAVNEMTTKELGQLGITPSPNVTVKVFRIAKDAKVVFSDVAIQDKSGYWTSKTATLFRARGDKWVKRGSGASASDGVEAAKREMNECTMTCRVGLVLTLALAPAFAWCQDQTIRVSNPTSLDWTFALANQSLAEIPDQWLPKGFDSAQQSYDIVVPKSYNKAKSWPLLLFISPSQQPAGLKQWGAICRRQGILMASPHDAGNACPTRQRVRIVADVLDDIRSKYSIDADRTYIGGFSGGGRIACSIALALPEYFGGVIPVCAGGELRSESWLRQRTVDRLSIAQLTGTGDFNRGEVERLHQIQLSGVGVRCRTWVTPGVGHSIPPAFVFAQAWRWLEEDLDRRQRLAKRWPASRVSEKRSREEWATMLLDEANERIKSADLRYSGLMQMKGLRVRWHDLPAAQEAFKTLALLEQRGNDDWQAKDIAEQRRFLIARRRGLDAYASGDLPKQYAKQRSTMLTAAISHWQRVVQDGVDVEAVAEANKRIPLLQAMLE